jgi:hypothetical protein
MLEVTKVTISPLLPLIGKDLDARATLNADVAAAEPDLLAGTIMVYSAGVAPNDRQMRRALDADLTVAGIANLVLGILAADSYAANDGAAIPTAVNRPAMIYRAGTFIRSTVNDINGTYIPPLTAITYGSIPDLVLNDKGIFLEESWDEPALG